MMMNETANSRTGDIMSQNQTIAATILEQLGGSRFVAMTGSRGFLYGESMLQFQVRRNGSRANRCMITLDPSDTYTVKLCRITGRGLNVEIIAEQSDVYAEMLAPVFERVTGFATRL